VKRCNADAGARLAPDGAMSDVTRSVREGLGFGLIAGTVFAIAQVAATMIAGDSAILAFRRLASVVLGSDALAVTPAATAVGVGIVVHLYLSAMYGAFYGIYNSALTMTSRRSLERQALIGPLFGVMLWLVNFQVLARVRYPWWLDLPQLPQICLHAVFFGLPLGLLYATAERRVVPAQRPYSYQ
jgi:hypothetical protein